MRTESDYLGSMEDPRWRPMAYTIKKDRGGATWFNYFRKNFHRRTQTTQIKQVFTEYICGYLFYPRHLWSIFFLLLDKIRRV